MDAPALECLNWTLKWNAKQTASNPSHLKHLKPFCKTFKFLSQFLTWCERLPQPKVETSTFIVYSLPVWFPFIRWVSVSVLVRSILKLLTASWGMLIIIRNMLIVTIERFETKRLLIQINRLLTGMWFLDFFSLRFWIYQIVQIQFLTKLICIESRITLYCWFLYPQYQQLRIEW